MQVKNMQTGAEVRASIIGGKSQNGKEKGVKKREGRGY
jgi:hypothetical protein